MRAMVLERPGTALVRRDVTTPTPGGGEALIEVEACGVCRTDLHIVDGELANPALPLIMGHEVVGRVVGLGAAVLSLKRGERVGVGWLGHTCGCCAYCRGGRENLCDAPLFTGFSRNGGYAERVVADAAYCLPLPDGVAAPALAPLMCAGLIGFRSYKMVGEGVRRLGIYGFGAAAHILTQIAAHAGQAVFAFTRPGDQASQAFARRLGAVWAGDSTKPSPEVLDAAIIFAPVGSLVPLALRAVRKGGTVVCGGIHMSAIPTFAYADLWGERVLRSVANLTRKDGEELLQAATAARVHTEVEVFPLAQANEALAALRAGELEGAAVLVP
ncbi:MAG: zinc-dependent alcohol dehydrogenase family protein [Deltaproteobacteria bacterium]|nr:zinc-dependent alcohol dehydrogenase family protein [Deltaproteobacteria bacterium]